MGLTIASAVGFVSSVWPIWAQIAQHNIYSLYKSDVN